MNNKASIFMKKFISALISIGKGKFTGLKGKTEAIRIRLLIFSLTKSRRLSFAAMSNKIQSLLHKKHNQINSIEEENPSENSRCELGISEKRELLDYYGCQDSFCDENDKCQDLTHSSLFDEDDNNIVNQKGSVIELVKNSKGNEGEEFKLEDEIDHVADLFIKRFKRQMLLQKWESFKRLQDMLGRSA